MKGDSVDVFKKMSPLKLDNSDLSRLRVLAATSAADLDETDRKPRSNINKEAKGRPMDIQLDSSYSSTSTRSSMDSFNSMWSDDHDFTRVKSTITSDLRYKIARNEPVKSYYYKEHIKTFGKPPFILGTKASNSPRDLYFMSSKRRNTDGYVP